MNYTHDPEGVNDQTPLTWEALNLKDLKKRIQALEKEYEILMDRLRNGIKMDDDGVYRLVYTERQIEDLKDRAEKAWEELKACHSEVSKETQNDV